MYLSFFGLRHEPFSIAPDPRYLFMSERHREALAHLLYGVRGGGGFVLLSGEIGAGKTTVCRCFLEQIPKRCNVAYIFNPKLTVEELLRTICEEFRIPAPERPAGVSPSVKDYVDALNDFLLKTHAVGQNNVLIIDEAQNLSAEVLEQLRLLTNLETSERKLLQIILIGQPELRAMLARPELEQLAQRVTARFHLDALTLKETVHYIRHRLAVAGLNGPTPFDREALVRLHELSRGVPRRINLLADRALLGAYASGKQRADRAIVDKAAAEVFGTEERAAARRLGWRRAAVFGGGALAGAAVLAGVLAAVGGFGNDRPAPVTAQAASAPQPAASAIAQAALPAGAPPALAAASTPALPASGALTPISLGSAELKSTFGAPARDEKDAWREFAQATWGITLPPGDPCAQAAKQRLQCFRTGGFTLPIVRQLGRPGIVTLYDDTGRPVPALLTALSAQAATLRIGGVAQVVSTASLEKLWRGDFATFWRMPPGYGSDAGAATFSAWLDEQLAKVGGAAALAPGDAASQKARIAAFQTAHGLKADGLVGPLTIMQLNRASGVDEPRLLPEP